MEKIALYRKYRPLDFDHVVGQTAIVKSLYNHVVSAKINHAYIFAGTKGSGKTSLAKIYAKAVNCLEPRNGNPCNQCANCQAINAGSCSDVLELDAASNNGVNEIRAIIDAINYVPTQLTYKVYIIDEAHMLTSNSWNALLKTLEEPPSHVILIFATTEFHKIPATIVSRCQRFDFTKIKKSVLTGLLQKIAQEENITVDPKALQSIVTLANGSARDALSVLDQLANYTTKNISMQAISDLFGLVDIENKINFLNALLNKQLEISLQLIKQFNQAGVNFGLLAHDLLEIVMEKLIFNDTKNAELLNILDAQTVELIDNVGDQSLINIMQTLNGALGEIKASNQPETIFEYYCLTVCKDYQQAKQPVQVQASTPKAKPVALEKVDIKPAATKPLFKTSELQIEKPKKPKVVTPEPIPSAVPDIEPTIKHESIPISEMYNQEYEHAFFCIANNYDKTLSKTLNNTLEQMKAQIMLYPPEINLLMECDKFLLASKNGAVLLFNNLSQVKRFNEIKHSKTLVDFYLDNFKCQQTILAIDFNKAKELKLAFQNLTEKNLPDVKIKETEADDKKTKLLSILNEETNT